jgi:predicted peptidase
MHPRCRAPLVLALAVFLLAPVCGAVGPQTSHVHSASVTKRVTYPYLRSLPAGYEQYGAKWPLLLFLHGAGERGTDVALVAKHGPPKLLAGGAGVTAAEQAAARVLRDQFIVVSPQCPAGEVWDDDALLALLDKVLAELRVDRTRVYLSGLSMGGYGTWSLALKHPERFAAAVPVCGGGRLLEILISRGMRREALQRLPVWAFHGAQDPTVPPAESERMIDALRRIGAKEVQLTVYPEARHDSWTETYANVEVYTWLLRHALR